jgi:acyl-CoA dehydrogenase
MKCQPVHSINIETTLDLSALRAFVLAEILPREKVEQAGKEVAWHVHRGLHALGFPQIGIPEPLGGRGAPMIDLLCMAREVAYGSAGISASACINLLALTAVARYAGDELGARLCAEAVAQHALWSYCMTEAEGGSDLSNLKTSARRVEGGYVVNGTKCFATNGSVSSHLLVFARLDEPPRRGQEIALFYVPGCTSGLTRGERLRTMGQREADTAPVLLHDVFVPLGNRIGEEGQGLAIHDDCIQRSKAMLAACGIGVCRRAFDLVTERLSSRVLYRRPLLHQPAIRHQLAALCTEVEAAWLLACAAGARWDAGYGANKEASMAKAYSADVTVRFVGEALELFGGYGYLCDYEIERLYRDAKMFELAHSPTLVQQVQIASALFD